MTTDITELAQSLKAAAIDAKELAIIARYSKGRAAAEKFYALANPANILALVEALERKEEQRANWFQMAQKLGENLDTAEKRIAELESRTVTVKLPERYACELGYNAPDPSGDMLDRDDVLAMLADAGIKVEAE
ncbi:ead/Ea22-like family protein [Klebsiella pneumoniae]|uniref:ead/Ea22-like family protein n=1 Tax=Klebsiella pneumoniae TaxID=573 RepID=UPI0008422CC0|nr:ead/Ea22-like family protein [Klebsiella pneumoniae]ODM69865.1 hypothetical protein A8V35_03610 [Klebsiella pneumoniae]